MNPRQQARQSAPLPNHRAIQQAQQAQQASMDFKDRWRRQAFQDFIAQGARRRAQRSGFHSALPTKPGHMIGDAGQ